MAIQWNSKSYRCLSCFCRLYFTGRLYARGSLTELTWLQRIEQQVSILRGVLPLAFCEPKLNLPIHRDAKV
jgi:hypothetical protein